jgi:hypothetical protein
VSEWRDKPWYPGRPREIVMYETPEDGWRFALATEKHAIVDGKLGHLQMSPDDVKAEMLRRLLETERVELDGSWRPGEPGWWSADLRPVDD